MLHLYCSHVGGNKPSARREEGRDKGSKYEERMEKAKAKRKGHRRWKGRSRWKGRKRWKGHREGRKEGVVA